MKHQSVILNGFNYPGKQRHRTFVRLMCIVAARSIEKATRLTLYFRVQILTSLTFRNKFKSPGYENQDLGHQKNDRNKVTYYLSAVTFFILWKVNSVQTMRHIVLCHPLIRILSSLGRDSDYLGCSAEVSLQPLVPSVVSCGPGPHVTAAATVVKTSEVSGVVHVPYGRGCDHVIFETTRLQSHWSVA